MIVFGVLGLAPCHNSQKVQVHGGDQSPLPPLCNSFVGTGIHNGPVPPANLAHIRNIQRLNWSFSSVQMFHTHTHLLRTIIANSDVECILRAKTLQLYLTGMGRWKDLRKYRKVSIAIAIARCSKLEADTSLSTKPNRSQPWQIAKTVQALKWHQVEIWEFEFGLKLFEKTTCRFLA